jgi:spore coat protein U-like protein
MKTLFNFTQQPLKLALASTLAFGAATMSGSSVAASPASSTMTVDATLTAACEVTPTAAIHFGSVDNLHSSSATANTAGSFTVACTSDAVPLIYATGSRSMLGPAPSTPLPFNLSLTIGAPDDDLPATLGAAASLGFTQDGTPKPVTLYATIPNGCFATAKTTGAYTVNLTVSVAY